MSKLKALRGILWAALLLVLPWAATAQAVEPVKEVRLYALDCGQFEMKDGGMFSDTFEYNGKPHKGVDPCFVIRHPRGTLVWDTGIGDKFATQPDAMGANGPKIKLAVTLPVLLKQIGLTPDNVNYLAFSHFHFDHTGNANEFTSAVWIINRKELEWAESKPGPFVDLDTLKQRKHVDTVMIDGDHDVFGDGTVVILKTPGHTPGHQSLMLKLKKAGTVILSGDLYHLRENRQFKRVPVMNTERADTLASMDRIETILKNTKGRIVIQHDPRDFAALPKFPKYLD